MIIFKWCTCKNWILKDKLRPTFFISSIKAICHVPSCPWALQKTKSPDLYIPLGAMTASWPMIPITNTTNTTNERILKLILINFTALMMDLRYRIKDKNKTTMIK